VITTQKLQKVTHRWTGTVRQRPNGTYYLSMPMNDIRAFFRKLPHEAHACEPNKEKSFVIVDVLLTWEGLVHD